MSNREQDLCEKVCTALFGDQKRKTTACFYQCLEHLGFNSSETTTYIPDHVTNQSSGAIIATIVVCLAVLIIVAIVCAVLVPITTKKYGKITLFQLLLKKLRKDQETGDLELGNTSGNEFVQHDPSTIDLEPGLDYNNPTARSTPAGKAGGQKNDEENYSEDEYTLFSSPNTFQAEVHAEDPAQTSRTTRQKLDADQKTEASGSYEQINEGQAGGYIDITPTRQSWVRPRLPEESAWQSPALIGGSSSIVSTSGDENDSEHYQAQAMSHRGAKPRVERDRSQQYQEERSGDKPADQETTSTVEGSKGKDESVRSSADPNSDSCVTSMGLPEEDSSNVEGSKYKDTSVESADPNSDNCVITMVLPEEDSSTVEGSKDKDTSVESADPNSDSCVITMVLAEEDSNPATEKDASEEQKDGEGSSVVKGTEAANESNSNTDDENKK